MARRVRLGMAGRVRDELSHRLGLRNGKVQDAFLRADVDRSGALSHAEFRGVLADLNMPMGERDFERLLDMLDPDRSGAIDYNEFVGSFGAGVAGGRDTGALSRMSTRVAARAGSGAQLTSLDLERGGHAKAGPKAAVDPKWTPRSVDRVVGEKLAAQVRKVQTAFRRMDRDKSGAVSYRELRNVLANLNIAMSDDAFAG